MVGYLRGIQDAEFFFFFYPYCGSGKPLSPRSGPLLPWRHFSSIYLDQWFPEALAQRELTAIQISLPQCTCSDYDSSVTDHSVFACTVETICICTVNSVCPECIWLATHAFVTCVACAEVLTHSEHIRFIVHARVLCAFISFWKK